ncbi:Spermine/spermidine synthase [Fontibacillus panacisegetis]|uniref:Spermine/spermidine synthase n=1 Tax=Fontibacillus panacisegetis TaxID=670482 RepID=A0A1G7GGX3_9BACL|nr:spermine/spermidine synthase [Fontibacillus panacisegetis]SDE87380.1 Spermine/spermidine synthase [Fontibacillus panacisegetis]
MNYSNCPVEIIERAITPRGEIQLQRRGEYFEVISNGTFLMATYNGESERLLVRSALQHVANPKTVLIGGLGVGFSLQEALLDKRIKQVTVVEIEEKVIEWNRSVLGPASNYALSHPKCKLVNDDLISWIQETGDSFDLICLDIDNGPDWKVFEGNSLLYDELGLKTLTQRLNPGGSITFWSATPSPNFKDLLESFFGEVFVYEIPQSHGDPDYIFLIQNDTIAL